MRALSPQPWADAAPGPEPLCAHGGEGPAIQVRDRAEALFRSRKYMCAEAILIAINEIFAGGLPKKTASGLAAALPEGLGGAGCLCGAVSGAALGLGLILSGRLRRSRIRAASRRLHNAFKQRHGSTCCRVLTRPVTRVPDEHFDQCARLTAFAAYAASCIILEKLPGFTPPAPDGPKGAKPSWLTRLLGRSPA